jgi:hypothetical protein
MDQPKNSATLNPQYLIFFSTAAAISAAVVAIAAQTYLKKRAASVPEDLLARCQQAIKNIEQELESLK